MGSIAQMIISEETRVVLSIANIGLVIFGIWFVARIYFNFKAKSDSHSEKIKEHDNKIETLENENTSLKVTQAIITTKLESIDVGIIDIKAMLLRHIEKE